MKLSGAKHAVSSVLSILVLSLAWGGQASASAITYSGSSGNLAAAVTFSLTGNNLTVTLSNTSLSDVKVPQDVLLAVWFDATHSLSPVSASLNGSSVFYGSLTNVGDGWGYYSALAGGGHGMNNGITAAGFGIGGGHSNFSGAHNSLGGLNYGLLSAGDNPATGNTGVKGHGPLINDSVQFTLTAGSGFNLSELGNTVVFQYGTSLNEPSFSGTLQTSETGPPSPTPEPGTLLMVGSGMLGMAGVLRCKLKP